MDKHKREGKGFKEFYKSYPTKEARAGHSYNISKKHHEREAEGMKKAMHKKYPGSHHMHGADKP